MYVAQIKPKLFISIGRWGKLFRLPDRWYVRQMKLFNFMDCRASWTPGKLHGSLHLPPKNKKDPSVALGTPSVTLKILPKW